MHCACPSEGSLRKRLLAPLRISSAKADAPVRLNAARRKASDRSITPNDASICAIAANAAYRAIPSSA